MNIMREIPVGKIRQPAVAGAFYPAQAVPLRQMVETYLKNGITVSQDFPKAIVAPHAGYQFSGPIAGSAFKPWQQAGETIRRVVLIGPSHFVGFEGLALSPALAWQTPLGVVPVDAEGMEIAAGGAGAKFLASAHAREHCLEVELAFLQSMLKDFAIVPIVTGDCELDKLSDLILKLWGGPETVFVISSDLSHFLEYHTARELDRQTADAIEELELNKILPEQACGQLAIQGMLQAAAVKQLKTVTADLRNSGDTAGSRDRVVGYGAFIFT
jgi:AmmeMemoRadiSam system protein B